MTRTRFGGAFDRRRAAGAGTLLPLTLEMGTWAWWVGRRRHMRRHLLLLDFLFRYARAQKKPAASST